jgi:hypothetical protein
MRSNFKRAEQLPASQERLIVIVIVIAVWDKP